MDSESPQKHELPLPSQELEKRYARPYFYGETSSYRSEGYRLTHPKWTSWLDIVSELRPRGIWIDVGSAYGYLVSDARGRGFSAWGLDASSYALTQEADFKSFLVQGRAEQLPFRRSKAQIVTLFNILEHSPVPEQVIREAVELLTEEGLLVGATPDPILLEKEEPNHQTPRPPSFWLEQLRLHGLVASFRFSADPDDFQFVAARAGTRTAEQIQRFHHDYVGARPDFVQVSEPDLLTVVPRFGWEPLSDRHRPLTSSQASIYLHNPVDAPVEVRISASAKWSGGFSRLRARFNSLVLEEVFLSSESTSTRIKLPAFQIPGGGHHLWFEAAPSGPEIRIGEIDIIAERVSHQRVTQSLPFDLYQRYQRTAEIAQRLRPKSILDVGGCLGDRDGHLATSADFLGPACSGKVESTDLRHTDHPDHTPAVAWKQPYPPEAFDLVVSLDVLEHLPLDRRLDFLEELDRVAGRFILLGAPFNSPETVQQELQLSESLLSARKFLQEHRDLGLPQQEEVEAFFAEKGYGVTPFENGRLDRWQAMQILTYHYFSLHDYQIWATCNRIYNERVYPLDHARPSYRRILLITKDSDSSPPKGALSDLEHQPAVGTSLEEALFSDPRMASVHQRAEEVGQRRASALHDVQFLNNERTKLIALLQKETAHLREELDTKPLWELAKARWNARKRRR